MSLLAGISASTAQISPEEHASHHPQGGGAAGQAGQAGGMMADMANMMKGMGVPPRKELYPSLMDLPDLSESAKRDVEARADRRFREGAFVLSQGTRELSGAIDRSDTLAQEQSLRTVREGLSLMESGLATKRLLEAGKPPREIALDWFRREMHLKISSEPPSLTAPFGLSFFHLTAMALLLLGSSFGLYAYVARMQRTRELLLALTAPGIPGGGTIGAQAKAPEPINPSPWKGTVRIAEILDETPAIRTFRLVDAGTGKAPFSFTAGQFVTLTATINGKKVSRSYTIASSPTEDRFIDLTIKREDQGLFSRYLHDELKVGSTLDGSGPQGVFTFTGSEAESLVLIGAGVGVTPLMSVLRYLTATRWPGRVTLLFVCRTPADFLFRRELEETAKSNPNFRLVVSMTKAKEGEWQGLRGRFTSEMIEQNIPGIRESRVHICGPGQMMEETKAILLKLGVPAQSIKLESFGPLRKDESPAPLGRSEQGSIVSTSNTVLFKPSNRTAFLPPDLTVLEAADSVGVEIQNSCRAGTCGLCKVRLLSGQVSMEVQDSLTGEDKRQGVVLACQAKSAGSVVVEVPPE